MPLSFSSHFIKSEEQALQELLHGLHWTEIQSDAAQEKAIKIIHEYRNAKRPAGQLEAFLQEYSLDTEEGIALMTLAEALLRIPDAKTAHALIHDKVAASNWLRSKGNSNDWVVRAAGLGLFMSSKTLDSAIARIGEPFLHQAMIKAMGILGKQFVLGQTIEGAFQNGQSQNKKGYRISYDILGEGARTAEDAERYYNSYANAISYIGERVGEGYVNHPGISVKLSALHPRYEFAQSERCIPEM
ncbi:MAG: proline dehydrogenase family protein, partial [Micavibrio sp.]|nr:proline dehydrogenase family protein [Micavibrio sp.]